MIKCPVSVPIEEPVEPVVETTTESTTATATCPTPEPCPVCPTSHIGEGPTSESTSTTCPAPTPCPVAELVVCPVAEAVSCPEPVSCNNVFVALSLNCLARLIVALLIERPFATISRSSGTYRGCLVLLWGNMDKVVSLCIYTDSSITHCWDDAIICDYYQIDDASQSGASCCVFGELPCDGNGTLIHPNCVSLVKEDNQCVTF